MSNEEERDMSIHPEIAEDRLVLYVKKGEIPNTPI
jgi:hypothetical protein